jgi:hypothetical protein
MSCGCAAPRRCLPIKPPSTWDLAAAHHPRPATPAERAPLWRAATPARPRRRAGRHRPQRHGLLDTLERDGLMERLPHPHDRRASCWPPSAPPSSSCWPSSRGRPAQPAARLGVAAHRAGTTLRTLAGSSWDLLRRPRAQTGMGRHAESSGRRRPAGDRPPSLRQRSPSTCCAGLRRMHPVGGRPPWTPYEPDQPATPGRRPCQPHPLGTSPGHGGPGDCCCSSSGSPPRS